jgi:hypothetical protein
MERVGDRKNGRIFFDRPKPTVGCSASGRRRRRIFVYMDKAALKLVPTFCSHYWPSSGQISSLDILDGRL